MRTLLILLILMLSQGIFAKQGQNSVVLYNQQLCKIFETKLKSLIKNDSSTNLMKEEQVTLYKRRTSLYCQSK